MRFDPKVISAEEPPLASDGEIELPADLSALAEQLGDDAAHLADCYQPGRATHQMPPSPASRRRGIAIATAALGGSALAAAIAITLIGWQGPAPLATSASSTKSDALPPSFRGVSATAEASVSLADLSGPELEAWLDLMEREPGHRISVSF